ncbi:MAG: flagellar M-ring protein FliF [Clostridiales bacterium]|nr:flagellar M-ring protein FliF [Clostridiales bacterium]
MSKRNRILLISCAAAVLVIAVGGALLLNANKSSTPLLVNLSQTEATEIIGKLQDMGVNATYSKGTISVPSNQEDTLRAQLVLLGYPKQGMTYDVFKDNVGMMATDFEKETFKLYDLQDRIAGTIRHFEGVEDAVVFISTGNNGKYVLEKDKEEPSVGVTVFMRGRGSPSPDQVKGIQRLVTHAIPGMKTENVAVVDGNGNDVTDGPKMEESGVSRLKRTLESEIEESVRSKVEYLIEAIFGPDKVRVSVSCSVDVKKKIQERIDYYPVEGTDHGVTEHMETIVEAVGQGSVVGGVPGTELNANIPIYPNITSDGSDIYYTDEKAFDYLVSQMKEQIQDDGGDILDLSVGIAVDEERLTRTQKEDLRQMVANAAGISVADADQKVSVVNYPFARDTTETVVGPIAKYFEDNPLMKWVLIGALGLLLLLIVLFILVWRKVMAKKRRKQEEKDLQAMEEAAAAAASAAAAAGVAEEEVDILNIPLDQVKKTREMELKAQIGEFADLNPEIAAQLIKTWLKGGTGNEQ